MERGPKVLTRRIQQIFFGFVAIMIVLIAVSLLPALSSRERTGDLRDRWLPARKASLQLSTALVDQETGERGYVITGVPAGRQVVRARALGFAPVEKSITIGAGETVTLDFMVTQSALTLNEVVVTGTAGAAGCWPRSRS